MSLNVIPPTMRARHVDTGEWICLSLDNECSPHPEHSYYYDDGDEPIWADFCDFDQFEAVQ